MNRRLLGVGMVALLAACQPEQNEPMKQSEALPATAPMPAAGSATVAAPTMAASAPSAAPVKPASKAAAEAKPVAAAAQAPKVEAAPIAPVVAKPAAQPVAPPAPVPAAAPAPAPAAKDGLTEAEALALAKKRNCFACHMVDKKVVGPAWREVAAKYRGDAGAPARLEAKVAHGGSGVWGSMAMPPQAQASAEERAQLVRFILNLK